MRKARRKGGEGKSGGRKEVERKEQAKAASDAFLVYKLDPFV